MFIKQVKEQLGKMSEAEKEEWILTQAKLLEGNEQQSFLMSLSGENKVIYLPSQGEIEELCEKVDHGDIYLEYETHYYEFDDDGRYMDDWKVWHNDPFQAMGLLNRVFSGCHYLLRLNEYKTVVDILDRVCKKEAAHLYHKYGRDDKYVSYLETHLEKESETYVALINYYKEHDNFDGACRVTEQALEKCKDDLTEAFIYLLVDAEKREDKDKYKKLYSSAKRRRLADINRIDQALSDLKLGSYN